MALGERARRSMPRDVPMAWMDDLYEHPPVWVARGEGPTFTDVDNHTYLDFYIADMSGFCGHAPAAVVAAVRQGRVALAVVLAVEDEDHVTAGQRPRKLGGRLSKPDEGDAR
jgi:glutamate-1-semialdehyde aminotransferase